MLQVRYLFLAILVVTTIACSNFEDKFSSKPVNVSISANIPPDILNANLPANCLQATLTIGNNPPQLMSVSGALASSGAELEQAQYNVKVDFDCTNTGFGSNNGTVPLASASLQIQVDSAVKTLEFPATGFLPLIDSNDDGLSNVAELEANQDPYATPSNHKPIANAGSNQSNITLGNTVTLDGGKSNDPDNNAISYQWSFKSTPPASRLASLVNATSVSPSFTPDVIGTYTIALVVNDGMVDSDPGTVTIIVVANTTGNSAPIADAGNNQNVYVGDLVTLDAMNSMDPNGDPLTYIWVVYAVPSAVGQSSTLTQVTNPTSSAPSFTPDVPGIYVFTLTVSDCMLESTSSVTVSASVNQAPLANAGPDQTVEVNSPVTLDGSASSDAENDPLTYTWSFLPTATSPVTSVSLSYPTPSTATFVPSAVGSYKFALHVNDGRSTSAADTVIINVTLPAGQNSPPIAVITNSDVGLNVAINSTIQLDGSQSYDIDGNPISYLWTIEQKPVGSNVTAVGNSTTPDKASFVADVVGDYVISLVVNDGQVNSNKTMITVHASTANVAPLAVISGSQVQYIHIGESITLDGSTSSDSNLDPLSYLWNVTSKPTGSTITTSGTGNTAATFLLTPDIPGLYHVSLVVNDGVFNSPAVEVIVDTLIPGEGTFTAPALLSFSSDLPYHGSVNSYDFTNFVPGASYYQITGLTVGTTYLASIKNMTEDADITVRSNTNGLPILCNDIIAGLGEKRCMAMADTNSLVVEPVGSYDALGVGTYFDLDLTPVLAQGISTSPIALTLSQLPYQGTVDTSASYYTISGLTSGSRYAVTAFYLIRELNLSVYANSNDLASGALPLCSSPTKTLEFASCFANLASTSNSLAIKIDGSKTATTIPSPTNGTPFKIMIEVPPSAEGTLNQPLILDASQIPHAGSVDIGDSYYQLTGLTAAANYVITINNMIRDANLFVYADSSFSGTALCYSSLNGGGYDSCSATVPNASDSLFVRVSGANTLTGSHYDLSIR